MEFKYKVGQVSYNEARKNTRLYESLKDLLGKVDEKKRISDQDIDKSLNKTLSLLNIEFKIGDSVYEIGKLTLFSLIGVKGLGAVRISQIYRFYANLATFEDVEQPEIIQDGIFVEPLSFTDQIKPFSVIDASDKIILNISGNFIPFSKILSITSFETDGVETGLSFSFKNSAKISEGPLKGLKRGKMMTMSVLYSETDSVEIQKLIDLIGKRDRCII